MEDEFLNNELIEQFEHMLENKEQVYFDSEQLSEIISFYLDVSDFEYAKRALDYAFALHPDNYELKVKQIEYYLALTQLKKAAELIQQLKDVASDDLEYLLVVARFWAIKDLPRKAIQFYKKAAEHGEDLDFIYNCIGNEYLNLDEISTALEYFLKALELGDDNDYSFYSILQCYNELHAYQDCIKFLKTYIDDNPYSEVAWAQLGLQYEHINRMEEALEAYDYVTVINPTSIAGYTQKATILTHLERFEEAIETFEESLEFDDSPAITHLKIGECYEQINIPLKALKSYHLSIKEDPQLDKAWAKTSNLYVKIENYQEALFYLNRAIDLDETQVEYWKSHCFILIKLGQYEEAIESYRVVVELEPSRLNNWLALLEANSVMDEFDNVIEDALDALKHFNRAEIYYHLSNSYFYLGNEDLGKKALNEAVKLDTTLFEEYSEKYPILKNYYTPQNEN